MVLYFQLVNITQSAKTNRTEPFIEELEVELGPPGEATTQVKRVRRARAYMHQYTTEPPTVEPYGLVKAARIRIIPLAG